MKQARVLLAVLPELENLVRFLIYCLKICLIFCSFTLSSANLFAQQYESLELVFITSEYCPFCKAWERDVGFIYDNTPYADKAPLRRVDFRDVASVLPLNSVDVSGTPTFLILENNNELGRIEGYQSSELFFWALSEYVKP